MTCYPPRSTMLSNCNLRQPATPEISVTKNWGQTKKQRKKQKTNSKRYISTMPTGIIKYDASFRLTMLGVVFALLSPEDVKFININDWLSKKPRQRQTQTDVVNVSTTRERIFNVTASRRIRCLMSWRVQCVGELFFSRWRTSYNEIYKQLSFRTTGQVDCCNHCVFMSTQR